MGRRHDTDGREHLAHDDHREPDEERSADHGQRDVARRAAQLRTPVRRRGMQCLRHHARAWTRAQPGCDAGMRSLTCLQR